MVKSLGIIGVGNMGRAIARALKQDHPDLDLHLYNRHPEKITDLGAELSATIYHRDNLGELFDRCHFVLVGVKPKDLSALFTQISPLIKEKAAMTWVSMAVGVSLEELQLLTPATHGWVRMMPNTPIEIHAGMVTYTLGKNVSASEKQYFIDLFNGSANLLEIPESLFDIAGAIAGSGPAYIYLIIEALVDAGVLHGLSRKDATDLVVQTVLGSSKMLQEKKVHPAILKDQVTSPGGTTMQGLVSLEKNQLRFSLMEAISATVKATHKVK